MSEATIDRPLGEGTRNVTSFKSAAFSMAVLDGKSATFSLDGDMTDARSLDVSIRTRMLRILVGEAYGPHPDG